MDFTLLNTNPTLFNEQKYPSEQKAFFVRYADALINAQKHEDWLEDSLTMLRFSPHKKAQFKEKIIEFATYGEVFSRTSLGLRIKQFIEEFNIRWVKKINNVFNPNRTTLVSNLADYEFCPASFAINESLEIEQSNSWEKDEWLGEKKTLSDRHASFVESQSLTTVFEDSEILIDDKLNDDFEEILNSSILHNNSNKENQVTFFTNQEGNLRGNPDYIFETIEGKRIVVIEKFSKWSDNKTLRAFSNDLVKVYAYIFELNPFNVAEGFMLYWYWHYADVLIGTTVKKKIRIKSSMYRTKLSN